MQQLYSLERKGGWQRFVELRTLELCNEAVVGAGGERCERLSFVRRLHAFIK